MTGDPRLVVAVTVKGDPHPSERPRFNRQTGITYLPSTTTKAIRELRAVLRSRCPSPERSMDVEVELVFRRATRARVDVDNLAKTVLDACKDAVWKDDDQVVKLSIVKLTGAGRDASTTIRVRRVLGHELPTDLPED